MKKHHKKVIIGAVVVGIVVFLVLYFWNRYQTAQAAAATVANSTDAQMNASTQPGYLYAEFMPPDSATNYTSSDPTSPTTVTPITVQAYNAASASTIPMTAWAYNPNYQLYYQSPQVPAGIQSVPQIPAASTAMYVSGIEPA